MTITALLVCVRIPKERRYQVGLVLAIGERRRIVYPNSSSINLEQNVLDSLGRKRRGCGPANVPWKHPHPFKRRDNVHVRNGLGDR